MAVSSSDFIKNLQAQTTQAAEPKKKNDQIGKNEFLTMLVTQLKNQDPLNPMDGDQFAVNLAQFSQLEQLVDINNKLGDKSGVDATSLASYLGHEVILKTDKVQVEGGEGGLLNVDLGAQVADLRIDLKDANGQSVKKISLGAVEAGKHIISLTDLSVPNGEYSVDVSALTASGSEVKVDAQIGGIVSGFVPGPDPLLLLGSREVSPADISEVKMVSTAQ